MTTSPIPTQASATHPQVRESMHPGILSCGKTTSASEVARMMVSHHVHCVAVMGLSRDGRDNPLVWGIISDLDLLAAAANPDAGTSAADLAREPVIVIRPDDSLQDAAQAMSRYHASHLVVIEPEQFTPIGIISSLDIATVLLDGPAGEPAGTVH